jgi:hypothetical protein
MLPSLTERGNTVALWGMCGLGFLSIVLGVLDLWPASALSRLVSDTLMGGRHYSKTAGTLILCVLSFAIGYLAGYLHDLLFDHDDGTPKAKRRRRDPRDR